MKPELQQELYDKYPEQYKNLSYISCDDGWYNIINLCCFGINQHIKNAKRQGKDIEFWWSDQKSKFGGLRLYYEYGDEYISGVIYMAESLSYSTCCICGEKGQLCHRGGWFETFCDQCRIRNQCEIYKKPTDEEST